MDPLALLLLVEMIEVLYTSTQTALLILMAGLFREPFDNEIAYRQRMMDKYGQLSVDAERIIEEGTREAPATLEEIMRRVISEDLKLDIPEGVEVNTIGLERVMTAMAERAVESYDLTNTTMLQSTLSQYVSGVEMVIAETRAAQALSQAAVENVTGAASYNAAVRKAIGVLADQGITGFKDRANRNWSPEAYINMVTRTTVHNARIDGTFAQMHEYGNHVFQVSSHMGARPLCAPYQGRFFSDDGSAGSIYDIDGNSYVYVPLKYTSFGDPAGLFGINCRHRPIQFWDHLSRPHAEPLMTAAQEKENARVYNLTQEARAQERDIRAMRTKAAMYQNEGDADSAKKWNARARKSVTEYKGWCNDVGLTPRTDRTYIGRRRADEMQP